MSILRRYHREGNVYFITNVTYECKPILVDNIDLLWTEFNTIKNRTAFDILSWIILPDHFHLVFDPKRNDISNLLQRIKMSFGFLWRKRMNLSCGRVWQNRFWDHIIRDQKDLNRYIDYVHFNPVKHGYVNSPFDWAYSSIHKYHAEGFYSRDWGLKDTTGTIKKFGE